ncbi:acetate/propionate family kinase [Brachyspira pilosicoli]|uniref:Acetate kinase n=1 Tax=Brachyspira pilosicoli TaxID=52584 RepID=A0A5C8F4A4_BRAPL|nr:acetate kinase [Brachyspira pilosicoli]TXJ43991.1 acetate kinase [Brachyspira pilosicoli]
MNVLVINSGSSSIKYQLFSMPEAKVLAKGLLEKIGEEISALKHTAVEKVKEKKIEQKVPDHKAGMSLIFSLLTDKEVGVIADMSEISAVGHRVVHGGEAFNNSTLINNEAIKAIEDCCDIAPLHNPAGLQGISACREILKDVKMVGVFDTSFHQTIPDYAYMYAVPHEWHDKYKVRRYGFHGTSHKYVYGEFCKAINKPNANVIVCHLGNGASVTAVKNGESVDTSMGLTPLEGLVMGTRCGDMDPAVITFMMGKENLSTKEIDNIINKKSGLLGISGVSNDMRNLEEASKTNNRAELAIKMFCYRVKKYIGSYMAVLGHLDGIVFTGGIGENSAYIRGRILEGLDELGIKSDADKNAKARGCANFEKDGAAIKLYVIATDEEKAIAMDTYNIALK